MTTPETHHPIVLYPGKVTGGRPTVEVQTLADGTQEAYLVPPAAAPIATGIKVFQNGAAKNWYLQCRIRKSDKVFKPEKGVRQKLLTGSMPPRPSCGPATGESARQRLTRSVAVFPKPEMPPSARARRLRGRNSSVTFSWQHVADCLSSQAHRVSHLGRGRATRRRMTRATD